MMKHNTPTIVMTEEELRQIISMAAFIAEDLRRSP